MRLPPSPRPTAGGRPEPIGNPRLGVALRRRIGAPSLAHGRRGQRSLRESRQTGSADNPETGDPGDTFIDRMHRASKRSDDQAQPAGRRRIRAVAGAVEAPVSEAIVVAGDGASRSRVPVTSEAASSTESNCSKMARHPFPRPQPHPPRRPCRGGRTGLARDPPLFVVPEEFKLEPAEPWQLQLLVQRSVGARQGVPDLRRGLQLPDRYLRIEQPVTPPAAASARAPSPRQPQPIAGAEPGPISEQAPAASATTRAPLLKVPWTSRSG